MASDFQIKTSADLAALQRALKRMGETEMRKRITKVITEGTKPIKAQIKSNTSRLPSSGGLAARVAKMSLRTSNKTGTRTYGVVLKGTSNDASLRKLDRGQNRHLTFGKEPWHAQSVAPNFFKDGVESGQRALESKLMAEARKIAEEVEKSF